MKWINAISTPPPTDKQVHFRDSVTKHPITFGEAVTRVDKSLIEWLDESTPAEDWVKVEDAKFTYAEMMELAGYMAAADCNTPIEELKKEAESHIYKQIESRLPSRSL